MSHIAPTLCRKGIGGLTILGDDVVEVSNLNRQFFYEKDIGRNKALAMVENLQKECIHATDLIGYAFRFEEAIEKGIDLNCDVAICGVDNNRTRVAASRYFREKSIPVIFTAVSTDGDHGYVFVQEKTGPCFGCLFPDVVDSRTYPCPGTPAISEILQGVGAFTAYAVDSCLMKRQKAWNCRHVFLAAGEFDSSTRINTQENCCLAVVH